MLKITIPVNPIGKGRPRSNKFGVVYTPKTTKENQKEIRHHLHMVMNLNKSLSLKFPLEFINKLKIEFYLKRPKRLMRKKDPEERIPHISTPDVDNLLKQIFDSGEGFLWVNDKTIYQLEVSKWYHEKTGNPRIEIEIDV